MCIRDRPTIVPSSTMRPRPIERTARPIQSRRLGAGTEVSDDVIEGPFGERGRPAADSIAQLRSDDAAGHQPIDGLSVSRPAPVATGADLLEFEVVDLG